jgi:hypothetical protein
MGIQGIGSSTGAVDVSSLLRSRSVDASADAGQASQPAAEKTGGAPPAGGGGGAKPEASSASSSSSLTADKIYDARDLNQDGTVSAEEELMFALKTQAAEKKDQTGASSSQRQTGLSAYKQSQSQQGQSAALDSSGISV